MDAETLLTGLEPLAYKERVARMVGLGRQAREDPSLAAAIDALSRGGFYERQMALWSCAGSGDRAHVLRAAGEASALLGGLALDLLPGVCDDAELAGVLSRLPRARRLRFARKLWCRG